MPANNSSEMTLCDDEQVGVDLRRLHADALALLLLCWVPDWVVSTPNSPVMGQQHVEASAVAPGYVGGSWHTRGMGRVVRFLPAASGPGHSFCHVPPRPQGLRR